MKRRVLIAESDPELARELSELIDQCPDLECVGRVASARDAVDGARELRADVLVVDLEAAEERGRVTVDEAAAVAPHLGIVVLTGADRRDVAELALARGAAACATDAGDLAPLLERIRAVRRCWTPPEFWYG